MSAQEVLAELGAAGVRLYRDDAGALRCRAPRGAYTPARRALVAAHRDVLAAALEAQTAARLAELADVAARWQRGVDFINATGNRGPAVERRFEELAAQALDLAERIEAIAPGAAADLLAAIFAADEAEPNDWNPSDPASTAAALATLDTMMAAALAAEVTV